MFRKMIGGGFRYISFRMFHPTAGSVGAGPQGMFARSPSLRNLPPCKQARTPFFRAPSVWYRGYGLQGPDFRLARYSFRPTG